MQLYRLSSVLLVALLGLSLVACNGKSGTGAGEPSDTETATDTTSETKTPTDSLSSVDPVLTSPENTAQELVANYIEAVKGEDYAKAAQFMAYTGRDTTRGLVSWNYNEPAEKSMVDMTCDVVKSWLKASDSYEFLRYRTLEEDPSLHAVEVIFKGSGNSNRQFFVLKDKGDSFLIVNMTSQPLWQEEAAS